MPGFDISALLSAMQQQPSQGVPLAASSSNEQPAASDPQASLDMLISSIVQSGGDPAQLLQTTLGLASTGTGDAAVDALINLYNGGQEEAIDMDEGGEADPSFEEPRPKKKSAAKGTTKPQSAGGASKARHRPFRYIQLPVATAHSLYGEQQFPLSLCCRMYVDDEYIMEIPAASLVRCKHPRTSAGSQYQLYGVQDFRRRYEGNQIKIMKLERADEDSPFVCDIYFSNLSGPLLLTNQEANRPYEGPKGPVPASYRLAPIIPIGFVLRTFFGFPEEGAPGEGGADALSNLASEMKDTSLLGPEILDIFPLQIQLVIELNKQELEEVHSCQISHDPKSQVFRLMEDRPVSNALKGYNLLIEGWKKKGDGNVVVMICTGQQRVEVKAPSRKRQRAASEGADQGQYQLTEMGDIFSPESIALAMTSFLQSDPANPFQLLGLGSNAETDALIAQLFASNPEALNVDLSNVDLSSLAAILAANPAMTAPNLTEQGATEGADAAVSGLMALVQSTTGAVEGEAPPTDASGEK